MTELTAIARDLEQIGCSLKRKRPQKPAKYHGKIIKVLASVVDLATPAGVERRRCMDKVGSVILLIVGLAAAFFGGKILWCLYNYGPHYIHNAFDRLMIAGIIAPITLVLSRVLCVSGTQGTIESQTQNGLRALKEYVDNPRNGVKQSIDFAIEYFHDSPKKVEALQKVLPAIEKATSE
jgi:hypothetical protein